MASTSSNSGSARRAAPVLLDQAGVGVLDLRVPVQHPHVGVAGHAVEVEVVLLDVLAVVALFVRQAEEAFLEDRVAAVPEGQPQAEVLEAVAEAGQAVLVPAIGAAAGVVVREEGPGVAGGGVVLADGAPGAFRDVGPPVLPVGAAGGAVGQPAVLGGHVHRSGPVLDRVLPSHQSPPVGVAATSSVTVPSDEPHQVVPPRVERRHGQLRLHPVTSAADSGPAPMLAALIRVRRHAGRRRDCSSSWRPNSGRSIAMSIVVSSHTPGMAGSWSIRLSEHGDA